LIGVNDTFSTNNQVNSFLTAHQHNVGYTVTNSRCPYCYIVPSKSMLQLKMNFTRELKCYVMGIWYIK